MKINKITIAVNDMDAMVAFYNKVFNADLQPIPETPFYAGNLLDFDLIFCPNSITQITADKNRIQFQVVVDDVDALVAKAEQSGGSAYGDRTEHEGIVSWGVGDPDGNSIELLQA